MENNSSSIKEKNWFLPVSILIAAVLISGSLIYSAGLKETNRQAPAGGGAEKKPGQILDPQIGQSVVLGNPAAPVLIIEYGDYQCPFCAKYFSETEKEIRKNYVDAGKVKTVYKDLAFLGPESEAASLAAKCARDQNKYWQFHDAIFEAESAEVEQVMAGKLESNEHNGNLNREFFAKTASGLGMNTQEFLTCFDSKKYAGELEEEMNEAQAVLESRGKNLSTPTLFINGQLIQGALPYENFAQIIDIALGQK